MKRLMFFIAMLVLVVNSARAQPIGTIIAFAGEINSVPKGYLVCDGKEYPTKEYPELSKAIGTAWGSSGAGKFNLPDLRGMFLRGVNGARGDSYSDPDANDTTIRKATHGGRPGNNVGSLQDDAIKSHTHEYQMVKHVGAITGNSGGGITVPDSYDNETTQPNTGAGKETRPKNAYVYYLIKVKN